MTAPRLVPRAAAADRAAAISDSGSLIVTCAVGSGTAIPSGAALAAATYRRAWRSEIPRSAASERAAAAGAISPNSPAAALTRDAYSGPAAR